MKIYRYILIQNGSMCFDIDNHWLVSEDDPLIDELIESYNRYTQGYFLLSDSCQINRALFQCCYEIQLWNYHYTELELKAELKPYLWISYDTKYPFYEERPFFFKSKLEFEQRLRLFYELYGYGLRTKILYRSPFQKPASKKRVKTY